jgi:hypothetical protein
MRIMKVLMTCSLFWFIPLLVTAQSYTFPVESPVEQVKVNGNIHLELVAADRMFLEFQSDTVPDQLHITWSDGELILRTPTELKQTPAIPVKLHYTGIYDFEVSRGAVIQSADPVIAGTLSLKADTGGKLELSIRADSLSARVFQGSDIILSGTTASQMIQANTVGNFLGYELDAVNTWIKATTGAQVKVSSTGLLNVQSTSKAFVGYKGKPEQTEFKTSLGGEITQQNP